MKVKDVKPVLEEKRQIFSELQCIELKIRDNDELCKELNEKLGIPDIRRTIIKTRSSFYDKVIYPLEKMIDEAEIQEGE